MEKSQQIQTEWKQLTDLPPHILAEVQTHLSQQELAASELVCRKLRASAQLVWEQASKAQGERPEGFTAKQHLASSTMRALVEKYADKRTLDFVDQHPGKGREMIYFKHRTGALGRALLQPLQDPNQQIAGLALWIEIRDELTLQVFLSKMRYLIAVPIDCRVIESSQWKTESPPWFHTPQRTVVDTPFVPTCSPSQYKKRMAAILEYIPTENGKALLHPSSLPDQILATATPPMLDRVASAITRWFSGQ